MRAVYDLFVRLYSLTILVVSIFNPKARKWVSGRKNLFDKIQNTIQNDRDILWFHCSSLGEFEQGRPLIEACRSHFPTYKILLTFYSPSGYDVRKNYQKADYVFYLPVDTRRNAKRFVKLVKPKAAFFVKYEFWFNFINELATSKIPIFSVSAIFRPGQHFFKWYGAWTRKHLRSFAAFFVQNENSKKLLQEAGCKNVIISGDTRFDRVLALASEAHSIPTVEQFVGNNSVLVAGSTWPADEALLSQLHDKFPDIKIIIAPHEITESHMQQLAAMFNGTVFFYSKAYNKPAPQAKVLIIDTIGLLSKLYRYATITYVGGGFEKGIHNVLEAAVYGKPVVFGPNYHKFREARDMISLGAAFPVKDFNALSSNIKELSGSQDIYQKSASAAKSYVMKNAGAVDIIMDELQKLLD